MQIQIFICNFNTSALTNNLIDSIYSFQHGFNFKITVLDNSNKFKFETRNNYNNIEIIDNFNDNLLHINDKLIKYMKPCYNEIYSAKHAYSIQYLINNSELNDILLFDSDTVLLKPIDFIGRQFITIGWIEDYKNHTSDKHHPRIAPYIQYFNKEKIQTNNIQYFDKTRMKNLCWDWKYDTGASFYEDILNKRIDYKEINYRQYIYHYEAMSYYIQHIKSKISNVNDQLKFADRFDNIVNNISYGTKQIQDKFNELKYDAENT